MGNSSLTLSYFILGAYVNVGLLKYFYFVITLLLYSVIIATNVSLIAVICTNRSLQEPMYMFLCSLFVNELYGSTGLFPFLMIRILSDIHTVPAPFCFVQIFILNSYVIVEFFNLTGMSYDRYLAICHPLQYHVRMTTKKVFCSVALIWILGSIVSFMPLTLSVSLPLCGNIIDKVYCDNYNIVKLSCLDTTVNNIYGLIATAVVVLAPVSVIFYTYLKIFLICFSGSKQTRQKAVATCTPHLFSLLNFSFGAFFEILQSRFNMSNTPNMLRVFLSLYWLMCQPLFNPLIYGLNITHIRNILRNLSIS